MKLSNLKPSNIPKKTRWFIFAAIFYIAFFTYFLSDEPLDADVQQAINTVTTNEKSPSKAFQYLMGIDALASKDILKQGQQRISAYDEVDLFDADAISVVSDELATLPSIVLPKVNQDVFCYFEKTDCFTKITASPHASYAKTAPYRAAKQRYLTFLSFNEYRFNLVFTPSSPLPNYRTLITGQRVLHLESMLALDEKKDDKKLTDVEKTLVAEHQNIRKHLALSTNLLEKMIYSLLLRNNIQMMLLLKEKHQDFHYVIEQLNEAEMSFSLSAQMEITSAYLTAKNLKQTFDGHSNELYSYFLRLVFKPNMSTNLWAKPHRELQQIVSLNAEQFAKEVIQNPDTSQKLNLRNEIGNHLANVTRDINYKKYAARLFNVNAKIILANHALSEKVGEPRNPYGLEYAYSRSNHQMCFEGPLPDENGERCVFYTQNR